MRRWFFAYENDTRVDLAMRERLERSFGFCAPHTRRLLDLGASTSWLARWVFADVARAGARALAAPSPVTPGPCPACQAAARTEADVLGTLRAGLVDAEVRRLMDAGDALCLTHGLAIIERGGPTVGRAVATLLDSRLGKDTVTAREHLTSSDPDFARRRKIREEGFTRVFAAEEAARNHGPLGDANLVLDWPCCPLCAAADLAEWRGIHWLTGLSPEESAELRTDATLCARHLGDLTSFRLTSGELSSVTLTDEGLLVAVAAVIEHVAMVWRTELQGYLRQVDSRTTWWPSRRAAPIRRELSCQLCARRQAAVARTRRLLGLVAADPAYADRMARAHGVCLRHGLSTDLPPPWRRLVAARVGLLSYELDEAERKAGWDARWELRGAEMVAWRRAPTLLDGGVLGPVSSE